MNKKFKILLEEHEYREREGEIEKQEYRHLRSSPPNVIEDRMMFVEKENHRLKRTLQELLELLADD